MAAEGTGIDAIPEWAVRGAELGVGEITLNSMDRRHQSRFRSGNAPRGARPAVSVP